jgi:hypothetical protein
VKMLQQALETVLKSRKKIVKIIEKITDVC